MWFVVLGTGGQRSGLWFLGTGLARLVVLHARSDATAGAMARQPSVSSVRRTPLEGHRKDGDEAESREPLRPGTASRGELSVTYCSY